MFSRTGTYLESRRVFLLMELHRKIHILWGHCQPLALREISGRAQGKMEISSSSPVTWVNINNVSHTWLSFKYRSFWILHIHLEIVVTGVLLIPVTSEMHVCMSGICTWREQRPLPVLVFLPQEIVTLCALKVWMLALKISGRAIL